MLVALYSTETTESVLVFCAFSLKFEIVYLKVPENLRLNSAEVALTHQVLNVGMWVGELILTDNWKKNEMST